jgi:hypothetical protein
VTTVEYEILTPAGRRWVERAQCPLDVLAIIFLIDVILIWSFPDAPPAFVDALNIIVWIAWACFTVDYVARLLLSVQMVRFVRTDKLDLVMVLLPMLRLLRVFLVLRHSLASVSTERIAGSIVSLVVSACQRLPHLARGVQRARCNHHDLPLCVVVGRRHHDHSRPRSHLLAVSSARPSWSWASD